MSPFTKLFFFSFAMLILPIGGFFVSDYIIEDVLGFADGSIGSAVVAVILVHCVIAGFVYTAWLEGSTSFNKPSPVKKD